VAKRACNAVEQDDRAGSHSVCALQQVLCGDALEHDRGGILEAEVVREANQPLGWVEPAARVASSGPMRRLAVAVNLLIYASCA
jgi:hypothetical protein